MNYALFFKNKLCFSKTTCFTMDYALFFKNISFYNELCAVRLGAILGPFWHREGSMAEPSRAEPSRAGPGRAEPGRAGPSRAGRGKKGGDLSPSGWFWICSFFCTGSAATPPYMCLFFYVSVCVVLFSFVVLFFMRGKNCFEQIPLKHYIVTMCGPQNDTDINSKSNYFC